MSRWGEIKYIAPEEVTEEDTGAYVDVSDVDNETDNDRDPIVHTEEEEGSDIFIDVTGVDGEGDEDEADKDRNPSAPILTLNMDAIESTEDVVWTSFYRAPDNGMVKQPGRINCQLLD